VEPDRREIMDLPEGMGRPEERVRPEVVMVPQAEDEAVVTRLVVVHLVEVIQVAGRPVVEDRPVEVFLEDRLAGVFLEGHLEEAIRTEAILRRGGRDAEKDKVMVDLEGQEGQVIPEVEGLVR
jgi:hypothetical protein